MKRLCLILWVLLLDFAPTQAAAEKAVLEIAPSLSELGEGWTTNVVSYLLDPSSRSPEIDFQNDVASSPLLEAQRQAMKGNERTGCGLLLYGRGDLIMNSGLYRVFVQRWSNTRALHNAWVDWKMNPDRVVRTHPPVGEDFFWVCEWWRQTPIRQNFVFRRGLFHVTIEAGADSDTAAVVQLAQVIDGKIKARPLPDPSGTAPSGAGGSTASPSSTAVELWSTSLDLRQRLSPGEGVRFSTEPSPARDVIVVEPDKRFQTMLGLGASLEPTTCSNLWSMAAADRDEVIEQLFEYYAYGQFMKFIQRGAVRIASSRGSAEFDNVAFRNPDGSIVLVVANTTSESRAFEVRSGTNRCTHRLEGRTIVTMRWMDR